MFPLQLDEIKYIWKKLLNILFQLMLIIFQVLKIIHCYGLNLVNNNTLVPG